MARKDATETAASAPVADQSEAEHAERYRNRSEAQRRDFSFMIKLTLFVATLGLFTYYFWPWYKLDPVEFQHSHIQNLNQSSFEGYVLKNDDTFRIVKFYANWCDHCKSLAPIWAAAAKQNQLENVEFLQVECDGNGKLCRKAGVKGFPELKIFYNGAIGYSQTGALNETEMQHFIDNGLVSAKKGYEHAKAEDAKKQAAGSTNNKGSDEL